MQGKGAALCPYSAGDFKNRIEKRNSKTELNIKTKKTELKIMAELASKRIPVTAEIWEALSRLKRPGQTYDSLLEEMIALKEEHDFLAHLEEIEKTGDFVSVREAARKLGIKED